MAPLLSSSSLYFFWLDLICETSSWTSLDDESPDASSFLSFSLLWASDSAETTTLWTHLLLNFDSVATTNYIFFDDFLSFCACIPLRFHFIHTGTSSTTLCNHYFSFPNISFSSSLPYIFFLHFDWLFSTFIDTKSFLRAFFPNCISSVFFVISRTNLLFLLLLTLLATISDSRTTLHHCRLFNRQFKKFQYFSSYSSLLAVELLQTSSMLLPNNNTVFYRWCALDDWKMSHHPSNLLYDIGTDPISIWRSAATVFGVFLNELSVVWRSSPRINSEFKTNWIKLFKYDFFFYYYE